MGAGCPKNQLLLLLVVLATLGSPPTSLGATKPSLVFVTKSDACACTANLCVAGEQAVLNFLETTGDRIRYERVDLARDAGAGKTYQVVTLPVVLLLDAAGEAIGRFDSYVTEEQLAEVWKQHLSALGVQP